MKHAAPLTSNVAMMCLDENTVTAFVEGLLSEEARREVDRHVDGCEPCRLLLSNLAPLLGAPPERPRLPTLPSQLTISKTVEIDQLKWSAAMRVGRTLRDKWRLDRLLGVGGTAAVYEATHKNHGGRVAIKIIHNRMSKGPLDPRARKRFLREGYAANSVGHRGIVKVIDDDVDADGSIFLVSELVEGETLQSRLARMGPLSADEVLVVADDVLDILIAAHERGIVHRDIKPENILLSASGGTRLLDFGIASVREASFENTATSMEGIAIGTPAFMPPEQALGQDDRIGPRSDLWALGATMFTVMTGRLVHDARTVTDALRAAIRARPPAFASVLPSAPPVLAEIVDRALAFEPEDRWASARAMQDAVRAVRTPTIAEVAPPVSDLVVVHPVSIPVGPVKKAGSRVPLLVAASLLSLALGAVSLRLVREKHEPPPVAPLPIPAPSTIAAMPISPSTLAPPAPSVAEGAVPPPTSAAPPSSAAHVAIKSSVPITRPRPPVRPPSSSIPAPPSLSTGSSWLDRRTR